MENQRMKEIFKGVVWVGVRTSRFRETCEFYEKGLGLPALYEETGFRAYDLSNGDRIELFSEDYAGQEHFDTGPVVGFLVEDIVDARAELEKLGIEFIGPIHGNRRKWSHFRGPDGNVYEITARPKG
jgi:catechol 2,3-dioxygenase-like lactoylglutathione lyase family enzyme